MPTSFTSGAVLDSLSTPHLSMEDRAILAARASLFLRSQVAVSQPQNNIRTSTSISGSYPPPLPPASSSYSYVQSSPSRLNSSFSLSKQSNSTSQANSSIPTTMNQHYQQSNHPLYSPMSSSSRVLPPHLDPFSFNAVQNSVRNTKTRPVVPQPHPAAIPPLQTLWSQWATLGQVNAVNAAAVLVHRANLAASASGGSPDPKPPPSQVSVPSSMNSSFSPASQTREHSENSTSSIKLPKPIYPPMVSSLLRFSPYFHPKNTFVPLSTDRPKTPEIARSS